MSVSHSTDCHTMNNHVDIAIANLWCVLAGTRRDVISKSEPQPIRDCLHHGCIDLVVMFGKNQASTLSPQEAGLVRGNVAMSTCSHPTSDVGYTMWALRV